MFDLRRIDAFSPERLFPAGGALREVMPSRLISDGPIAPIGALCRLERNGVSLGVAEVVSVSDAGVSLVPLVVGGQFKPYDQVRLISEHGRPQAGDGFAGRIVDGLGRPLDARPAISDCATFQYNLAASLDRPEPFEPIVTGSRAIDCFVPIGRGQRLAVLAASGVGKTRLVEQIATQVQVDHVVLCLIGERGREVDRFARLAERADCTAAWTIVAATSDESAPMRVRAIYQALAIAEYWRTQQKHVLLVVDSATRLAMALREIGLAAGEPPTARGLTPNVFAVLPGLVERCGLSRNGGAITAVFTVLCESDDADDPIAEAMKSLLDGHIILSRELAEIGHYPAIAIGRSISRLSDRLVSAEAIRSVRWARRQLATYDEARILVESGMYRAGSDSLIDTAIAARPELLAFLQQNDGAYCDTDASFSELAMIMGRHNGKKGAN